MPAAKEAAADPMPFGGGGNTFQFRIPFQKFLISFSFFCFEHVFVLQSLEAGMEFVPVVSNNKAMQK